MYCVCMHVHICKHNIPVEHLFNVQSYLISLNLLPLMYRLELNDIMFFLSSLKNPSSHFNILDYFSFCNHYISTHSSVKSKLQHSLPSSSLLHHSFFHRLPHLWNSLSEVDLNQSLSSIKKNVNSTYDKSLH